MHAMGAPDAQGVLVLVSASSQGFEQTVEIAEQQVGGGGQLQGKRGVQQIRRGHAEVQIARLGPDHLLDVREKRDHVVSRRSPRSPRSAAGRSAPRRGAPRRRALSPRRRAAPDRSPPSPRERRARSRATGAGDVRSPRSRPFRGGCSAESSTSPNLGSARHSRPRAEGGDPLPGDHQIERVNSICRTAVGDHALGTAALPCDLAPAPLGTPAARAERRYSGVHLCGWQDWATGRPGRRLVAVVCLRGYTLG